MRTLSQSFIEKANARRAKLSARARGRERDAVEMHEEGMTYQQIGDILAVSRQFAHVLVQRAYARENSEKGQTQSGCTQGQTQLSTGTD